MPSALPLVTVAELRKAYHDAVHGRFDERSDRVIGSIYDIVGGTTAVLFARECRRDKDIFGAVYLDTAQGDDLTNRGFARYADARILDTYGTGTAILARPTVAGGGGTIYTGSRILVVGNDKSVYYKVSTDTPVGPAVLSLPVPVQATSYGPGPAITLTGAPGNVSIDDPLFDNTFAVQSLIVAPGTTFEDAHVYRSRIRKDQLARRVGYEAGIVTACKNAGCAFVALFRSDMGTPDCGINACFIGDTGYTASQTLINNVRVALEGFRVAGADLAVRPMQKQSLIVNVDVHLWDNPGKFDQLFLKEEMSVAICSEFNGESYGFGYRLDDLFGAMQARDSSVQSAVWNTPVSDAPIMTGNPPSFPHILTRYTLRPQDVTVNLKAPL